MTAITKKRSGVMRRLKRCCARRAMERHPKANFLLSITSITTILLSACAAGDGTETANCQSHARPGVELMIETMNGITVGPTTMSRDGCEPSILIQGDTKGPQKILLAVHGFADRAWQFNRLAQSLLNDHNPNLLIVAYDQRSFGWAALPSEAWPGADELVRDFMDVYNSIVRHYGKDKIFVLGHSMGAAVVVRAFTAEGQERLDFGWPEDEPRGLILAAPAICSAANRGYLDAAVFSMIGSALSETVVPTVGGQGGLRSQTRDDGLITETLAKGSGFHRCTPLGKVLGSTRLYADAARHYTKLEFATLFLQGVEDNLIDARLVAEHVRRFEESHVPETAPWFKAIFFDGHGHLLISEDKRENQSNDICKADSAETAPTEGNPVHQAIEAFLSQEDKDLNWLNDRARKLTACQAERAQWARSLVRCTP